MIAGTEATNTLVIRNPFPDQVVIETIEAPSSAPLLPRTRRATAENLVQEGDKESFWRRLISSLRAFEVKEVSLGPLVAHFPQPRGRAFNIEVEQDSYVTFKTPLGPQDSLNMTVQRSANVNFDTPPQQSTMRSDGGVEGMQIPSHQEDIASFELRTAHWLLVTPKVLQLYAVIGYRLGNELRRQAVPLSLCIYPAVMAIVVGGICGGILGYAAPQTNLNKSIIRRGEQLRTTLAHVLLHARLWAQNRVASGPHRCLRQTLLPRSTTMDWMEWQAGYVSGALLMPRSRVKLLVGVAAAAPRKYTVRSLGNGSLA